MHRWTQTALAQFAWRALPALALLALALAAGQASALPASPIIFAR